MVIKRSESDMQEFKMTLIKLGQAESSQQTLINETLIKVASNKPSTLLLTPFGMNNQIYVLDKRRCEKKQAHKAW